MAKTLILQPEYWAEHLSASIMQITPEHEVVVIPANVADAVESYLREHNLEQVKVRKSKLENTKCSICDCTLHAGLSDSPLSFMQRCACRFHTQDCAVLADFAKAPLHRETPAYRYFLTNGFTTPNRVDCNCGGDATLAMIVKKYPHVLERELFFDKQYR